MVHHAHPARLPGTGRGGHGHRPRQRGRPRPASRPAPGGRQEAHDRGARIVSLCSGAFVLAAAGLLDGRRAATHWEHAPLLAERYPAVDVDPTVLYIDDGDILTSAGSTAGIDLCLHVLRKDLGSRVAGSVARHLVVPAHRPGGQAQYIETPVPPAETDSGLAPLLHWAAERLHLPLTTPELARRAGTSERTLVRRFHQATGTTPLQWLQAQRISRAKELLETTDQPMDRIAEQCGLGGAGNLRLHFARSVGIPPANTAARTARRTAGPVVPPPVLTPKSHIRPPRSAGRNRGDPSRPPWEKDLYACHLCRHVARPGRRGQGRPGP
ncbi:helix-turn-helix domain-containing protein [Streptomyces stramineus]